MGKYLLLILTLLIVVTTAYSQVHYFHCLEVMDGDKVLLSWEAPGNEPDFVEYNIYHREPPAGFSWIKTITDYNSPFFEHNTTKANDQSVEYFIITERLTLPSDTSDTLSTIHLTVDNSDPYMAVLDWNPVHAPLLAGSYDHYRIYMHNPFNSFSLVDSTSSEHFEIPVAVCRDTLFFKVEIGNANACFSVSNIYWAVFADITPPSMPSLDSVSINPYTGEAILGWSPNSEGDIGGYQIYVVDVINDTLDPVINTYYIDDSFDPCTEYRNYAIAAFDTCGNISPGSYDIPQRTILFDEIVFDPCEMANSLSWTEYINMSPALEGYRIYLSLDGAPFEIHTTLPAGTISYAHEDLEAGHSYQYFIRAFSAADIVTSSSCFRELTTWQYKQPFENEIFNASVVSNELVTITLWPDTYAFVPGLKLYRSILESGPYELIDEFQLSGEDELIYDDLTADVSSQSYYYRSSLIDSCGNEVLQTNLMRTILLQGEKTDVQKNHLNWNAFEGWPAGVAGYEVYRAVNDGSFELIGSTDETKLTFEDEISSLTGDFSLLRYVVRAMDATNSSLYSWSNDILFEYEPSIYLPNAFTPEGLNPVYKPLGTNAEFNDYRFDIFNRWGSLLFTSRDFGTGWDGIYQNKIAPQGVYVCVISYRSNTGEDTLIKSTFVLIR